MATEILGEDGFLNYKSPHAGYLKGESWDDHGGGQVKHIAICYGSDAIRSIQTTYIRGGAAVMSRRHGGKQGNFELINLVEPPTWVSGCYGKVHVPVRDNLWNGHVVRDVDYDNVIMSLTFGTDKTTYGPFGKERGAFGEMRGEPFSFKAPGAGISGFHGCSSNYDHGYLHAIGVYVCCPATRFIDEPQVPDLKNVGCCHWRTTSSIKAMPRT